MLTSEGWIRNHGLAMPYFGGNCHLVTSALAEMRLRSLNPALGMYLLNKLIQFRENSHPDHEKPFLEHLEDLRVMIFRVVITLLISMIVCFTFQKQLMSVLRRPVDQVWQREMESKLPQKGDEKVKSEEVRAVSVANWEKAKDLAHAVVALTPEEREELYQLQPDQDLVFHARAALLLRSVLALPEDKQKEFVEGLKVPDDLKNQVMILTKLGTDAEISNRGNLKMMSALKPTETFMLSMKLSMFAGIILAFPLLLMYILQFVLPGMHAHEKKVLWPAMAIGFGLFLAGVFFAYYEVLPRALTFFHEWSGGLGVSNDWRIGEYISFATTFTLLFGVSFELPVVVMVFVKLGLLTYETMSRTRAYAILAIVVAAALLTPTPDVMTMSLMAAPMLILYELCIWLAWFDRRKNRKAEAEEARVRAERATRYPALAAEESDDADESVEDHDPYHDYHDDYHDDYVEDHDPYDEHHYDEVEDNVTGDFDKDPEVDPKSDDKESGDDESADEKPDDKKSSDDESENDEDKGKKSD